MKYLLTILFLTIIFPAYPQLSFNEINANLYTNIIDPEEEKIHIFENDFPLDITLSFDVDSFLRYKNKEKRQHARVRIYFENGDSLSRNIQIRARGNFRKDHCSFPPMNLYFNNDPDANLGLKGKIKLVTHCRDSKLYNSYVLKEYLIYKMYNIVTDKSFRVRLLNVTYVDTGDSDKTYSHFGFFIEPDKQLRKRIHSEEVEPAVIRNRNLYPTDADRMALFQYMIGNTDWKISDGHNLKFFKPKVNTSLRVIPVPYDFDYSGFVNTTYAVPGEWTEVESVRIRDYLGYCRASDLIYLKNIEYFQEKEEEIRSVIEDFNLLSGNHKKASLKYINAFFKDLKKTNTFIRHIKRECRTEF